jgi:hypothetical protein
LPITISGATGKFYVVRQPVTFTAMPAPGNNFYEWLSFLPGATRSNEQQSKDGLHGVAAYVD